MPLEGENLLFKESSFLRKVKNRSDILSNGLTISLVEVIFLFALIKLLNQVNCRH